MHSKTPLTLENRWDILYRDYPEKYDEFAAVKKNPRTIDVLKEEFDFQDKLVLDVGAGSGASAFAVATLARTVIGLEIEDSMRNLAIRRAAAEGFANVAFIPGTALNNPFRDRYFDVVMAVTLPLSTPIEVRQFAAESLRVTKHGGVVISVGIAPFWYGGELAQVILGESRVTEVDTEGLVDRVLTEEFNFAHFDYFADQEYGSLEKVIGTYGFIFGKKAIDYLTAHQKTAIRWKFRVHYRRID